MTDAIKIEMPTDERQKAVSHYDEHAAAMQNLDFFYSWVTSIIKQHIPQTDKVICDVGCGTGHLLAKLDKLGYRNLRGLDFSSGCLTIARQVLPKAAFSSHDIELAPLDTACDAILMTTVLDFLSQPVPALINLRKSLSQDGLLFITIRNRQAYWPFYHLRHFGTKIKNPRVRHWFLWFTTPLGLRRNDQPFERVYTPSEARALLASAGLTPVAESGMMFLPMFWIPDMQRLMAFMQKFDGLTRGLPVKNRFFEYMFVCRTA